MYPFPQVQVHKLSLGNSQNCSGNCSRNKRESLRSRYSLFPFLVPISICSQLLKKVSFSVQKIGACGGLTCSRSAFLVPVRASTGTPRSRSRSLKRLRECPRLTGVLRGRGDLKGIHTNPLRVRALVPSGEHRGNFFFASGTH